MSRRARGSWKEHILEGEAMWQDRKAERGAGDSLVLGPQLTLVGANALRESRLNPS